LNIIAQQWTKITGILHEDLQAILLVEVLDGEPSTEKFTGH
jgi:hypothetical protein